MLLEAQHKRSWKRKKNLSAIVFCEFTWVAFCQHTRQVKGAGRGCCDLCLAMMKLSLRGSEVQDAEMKAGTRTQAPSLLSQNLIPLVSGDYEFQLIYKKKRHLTCYTFTEGWQAKGRSGILALVPWRTIGVYQVEDEDGRGRRDSKQRIEQKNTETKACCSLKKQLSSWRLLLYKLEKEN